MNIQSPRIMKSIKTKQPLRKRTSRQIATNGLGHVFSEFVTKITVRPQKQQIVPIGNTFISKAPKGFSICLTPGNETDESIDMKVITVGTPNKYEYKLQISNNGDRAINAEVWAFS